MKSVTGRRAAQAAALIAAAAWVWRMREAIYGIAAVFALAGAVAALLSPLCRRLRERGMGDAAAAGVCVAGVVLPLMLAVGAFVPYLVARSAQMLRGMTPTAIGLIERAGAWLAQHGWQAAQQDGLAQMLASAMSRATARLASGGVAFAAQAGRMAFALVLAYYILCEREAVARHLTLCLPLAWRMRAIAAVRGCKLALLCYASGVLKTSAFVTAATYLGLAALGVRDALPLSLLMGVLEVLPYVGPVLAAVPIALSALTQGMHRALLALGLVVLVQQVEGNFVSPYFAASSTSLHPLAALASVFILGSLFGLWGVMLAVPAVVTARSLMWSLRSGGEKN